MPWTILVLSSRVWPFIILTILAFPAAAERVRVVDGDGLRIDGVKVRLWGIDALELYQHCEKGGKPYRCGQQSKEALQQLVEGTQLHCVAVAVDHFNRPVVQCHADGHDVATMMVRQGWALDSPHYSKGRYASDQKAASDARLGVWVGSFIAPWEWRKLNRSGKLKHYY